MISSQMKENLVNTRVSHMNRNYRIFNSDRDICSKLKREIPDMKKNSIEKEQIRKDLKASMKVYKIELEQENIEEEKSLKSNI